MRELRGGWGKYVCRQAGQAKAELVSSKQDEVPSRMHVQELSVCVVGGGGYVAMHASMACGSSACEYLWVEHRQLVGLLWSTQSAHIAGVIIKWHDTPPHSNTATAHSIPHHIGCMMAMRDLSLLLVLWLCCCCFCRSRRSGRSWRMEGVEAGGSSRQATPSPTLLGDKQAAAAAVQRRPLRNT